MLMSMQLSKQQELRQLRHNCANRRSSNCSDSTIAFGQKLTIQKNIQSNWLDIFLFVCFRLQKCVLLRLQSFLHLLYFAYFCRENTEGTPTQHPAYKKCCLFRFLKIAPLPPVQCSALIRRVIPASKTINGEKSPFSCISPKLSVTLRAKEE